MKLSDPNALEDNSLLAVLTLFRPHTDDQFSVEDESFALRMTAGLPQHLSTATPINTLNSGILTPCKYPQPSQVSHYLQLQRWQLAGVEIGGLICLLWLHLDAEHCL